MRSYPYPDPGKPVLTSPARYLLWLASHQKSTLLIGTGFGIVWMLTQAFVPFVIGRAIDDGIVGSDIGQLAQWVLLLIGLVVVQVLAGMMRHRAAISNWMQAVFKSMRLIGHRITRTGDALPRKLSTGEVVSTAASDATRIGDTFYMVDSAAGAVVGWLAVSFLITQTSPLLGLIVFVGVPLSCAFLALVVRPLQEKQREQREASGLMTAVGADTVAGLRVLRGIGGEDIFVGRYRERSATTRDAGIKVAGSLATLEASQVLLAGIFGVVFTWVGATQAINGDIQPGQLVALYGYSVFLTTPIRVASQAASSYIRAHVGARKIVNVLSIDSNVSDEGPRVAAPAAASPLTDVRSGVVVEPGRITAVVSGDPAHSAELATRLGRFDDLVLSEAEVRWGKELLHHVPLEEIRQRIVVSEASPQLFTGTLRSQLDPYGKHDDDAILAALDAASAIDIIDGLENGLDEEVTERGRSFSGGQRQRLVLARALLTEAEALVLIEPTSAVDAHTESRIAARLQGARGGGHRITVVVTASPLMLGAVDHVVFLQDGRVAAEGRHEDLIKVSDYRNVVIRSE
ncbi:ABC transporter transmembrane domain-containing protein [Arthrobacter roseus]|uniref:ABC transporter transmembrane domain-containing protein n=1 Tax=Arthrobacter roseus TaxID=136274 RepID=UPI001964E33D|nr:ABC-type multidrug transport system fused ATPase/permease subunit [Arthrobacter roseus]